MYVDPAARGRGYSLSIFCSLLLFLFCAVVGFFLLLLRLFETDTIATRAVNEDRKVVFFFLENAVGKSDGFCQK